MKRVFSSDDKNLESFSWSRASEKAVNSIDKSKPKSHDRVGKKLDYKKVLSTNEEKLLKKIKKEKNDIAKDVKKEIKKDFDKEKENFQYFKSSFEEMEKIKKDAYEKGFKEGLEKGKINGEALGYKDGVEKAKNEYTEKLAIFQNNLMSSIENIGLFKEKVLNNAKTDTLELAILIAKKIIDQEISLRPKVLISIIENSLQSIVAKDKINIFMSKEDYEIIKNEKFTLYNAEKIVVTADSQLKSGEIRIESDLEQLSYSVCENIDKLGGALKNELL